MAYFIVLNESQLKSCVETICHAKLEFLDDILSLEKDQYFYCDETIEHTVYCISHLRYFYDNMETVDVKTSHIVLSSHASDQDIFNELVSHKKWEEVIFVVTKEVGDTYINCFQENCQHQKFSRYRGKRHG